MTDSNITPRWQIVTALALVYVIWGSTYLGIRFAIETLPPFLMAGSRFVVAGAILFAWVWFKTPDRPTMIHWRSSLIVGGLLLMGGNGMVTWAEEKVPSGLAALMIGGTPLWIVSLNWLFFGGTRPNRVMALGLVIGLSGLLLLIGPKNLTGDGDLDPIRIGAILLASLSWSTGSLYSRKAALPASPLLGTAMEMLCGGALLLVLGTLAGNWSDLHLDAVSFKSAISWVYLSLFGSLVAFSAYIWLLHHTTPARAASYAYVNPVVAVFLGWALADEAISLRTVVAAAIIIGSVALITSVRAQQGSRPSPGMLSRSGAQPSPAESGK
jgi:drug/metabolite transporter (DMT)-like permease